MASRVLVIGANGTIGSAVVHALATRHSVIGASRTHAAERVDLTDLGSIRALFERIGPVDAVVCAAGDARFKPIAELDADDYLFSIHNKLMGQVNLTRVAFQHLAEHGSVTLTAGILARQPMPGSAAVSLVNAALEGFTRAAAGEAPRGIRVNVVSPPWVSETLTALHMDPALGKPAASVAQAYVHAVAGAATGTVIEP